MYKKELLYARVSSTKQDNLRQEKVLKDWAVTNSPNAGYIEDVGSGRNMSRKGIQKVIAGIRAGVTKRVVVVTINRVGRNVRQICEFLDVCLEHGCELYSINEKIDLSSPMGRMFVQLLAVIAELDNEQRREATLAGLDAKLPRDPVTGKRHYNRPSWKGYSLKVTNEKATAIFALRDKGLSYRRIGLVVGLSDKTVREVVLHPRQKYVSRKKHMSERNLDK